MTKTPVEIRSLARAQTALAIRTLTGVCGSKAAPAAARVLRPAPCSIAAGQGPAGRQCARRGPYNSHVSHRVLDVAVAEVSLQRPRIVALVGQRKATGVAQHVRMSRKAQLGLDASALLHARKACRRERRPPLAGEHKRRLGILLPLQLAQGPHFVAGNGMRGRRTLLGPAYVQDGVAEIDLIPAQVYKLGRPQTVAEGDKDHGGIPVTPAIGLFRAMAETSTLRPGGEWK